MRPRQQAISVAFCETNAQLQDTLSRIVPEIMHGRVGLKDHGWIDYIAGPDSRLALAEVEVSADHTAMEALRREYFDQGRDHWVARIGRRMRTIAEERTLNFLSRKAVIPKYGFPVDVVELEVRSVDGRPTGVALQRDLSQAIAEYAPGGRSSPTSSSGSPAASRRSPARHGLYATTVTTTQGTSGSGMRATRKHPRANENTSFRSSAS